MSAVPIFESTITKEALAELPPISFGGEIVVVDSAEQIDAACDELLRESLLGFDTESRPAFQKGVVNRIALLQLSTPTRCYLFRLNKIRLDKAIMKILENPKITKIGLSVAGDIRELETLRKFRPKGFVDLQKLAPEYGISELSLIKIAAITLGHKISKAQRLSNWEAVQLTDAQKLYAATDAWICTEIYKNLKDNV
jgi:ribonuclease D